MYSLSVKGVGKRYLKRWVISDVSIDIHSNEICCLLGPNGAGKTTLFYIMVGLVRPNRGEVFLGDENITRVPVHKRSQSGLSYLPQESSVYRKLSVKNNIIASLESLPELRSSQIQERCDQLLEEFHLGHIQNSLGMTLSGGERRRTEIARALASSPKFLLLDEPFAGIDPISIIDIKQIIRQLKERGIGILITDHNVRDTLDICDRAFIVNAGQVIAQGTPETVMQDPFVKKVYLGEGF